MEFDKKIGFKFSNKNLKETTLTSNGSCETSKTIKFKL